MIFTSALSLKEVTWAKALYEKHPTWLQIDVTLRSVEESAARILRQMSERYGEEHAIWCAHQRFCFQN